MHLNLPHKFTSYFFGNFNNILNVSKRVNGVVFNNKNNVAIMPGLS